MKTLIGISIMLISGLVESSFCSVKINDDKRSGMKLSDDIKITILFDNYIAKEGTEKDWGFSCLIEGTEKTILFDTGSKGEILLSNCKKLGVDLSTAEIIFLSHEHSDHVGGLKSVMNINPTVPVYVPNSFAQNFAAENGISKLIRVTHFQNIFPEVYSSGELGIQIKEHALVISTVNGLIVITGCSHPGIVEILKKVKEELKKEIYFVIGGFHLLQHSDEAMDAIISGFRDIGILKCGATHCTGDKQTQMLESEFGSNYLKMGTGRVITINSKGITEE